MSDFASLLPSNKTQTELAIEKTLAKKYNNLGVSVIKDVTDVDKCPCELLPYLAWSLSVDNWDEEWDCDTKREVIKVSVEVHKHKGTPWAVKRAVEAAGFEVKEIKEGCVAVNNLELHLHDGQLLRDGTQQRDSDVPVLEDTCYQSHYRNGVTLRDSIRKHNQGYIWAVYSVALKEPIRNYQAKLVRKILESVAPARCHLQNFDYAKGAHLHNNTITRNGEYNRGVAA